MSSRGSEGMTSFGGSEASGWPTPTQLGCGRKRSSIRPQNATKSRDLLATRTSRSSSSKPWTPMSVPSGSPRKSIILSASVASYAERATRSGAVDSKAHLIHSRFATVLRSLIIEAGRADEGLVMTRSLPTEQERIVAKCVHPTGRFVPFESAAIARSISERFEQMVALHPDRIAVSTTGQVLTYDELNQRANRVARALLARRGEVNEPIALFIEDRACMIAAILGVLEAGKIYVPVDPSDPQARIAFMLEDSRAALILSDGDNIASPDEPGNLEKIPAALPGDNLGLSVAPEAFACITYTSGSTGQPKGVIQNHRNVVHKVITATNAFHISVEDRLLLVYSCSFSASIQPIFGALLNGATVCAFDVQKGGTAALASWLKEQQVTAYFSVSTLFRHLAESLVDGE